MAKLVLDIEPTLIDKIKEAAEKQNVSLSAFAEGIFKKETEQPGAPLVTRESLPQWLKDLTISKEPTSDFDHKKEYGDHIERKYGI